VLDVTVGAAGDLTLLVAPATRDTRFVAPARAYVHDEGLGCWLEVGDADSEVFRVSDYYSGVDPGSLAPPSGRLAALQASLRTGQVGAQMRRAAALRKLDATVQVTASKSYVQGQLAAAAATQSAAEYRYWLRCYAQLLARHGLEADLRALFNAMLEGRRFGGGVMPSSDGIDSGSSRRGGGIAGSSGAAAAGAAAGAGAAAVVGASAGVANSEQLKRMLVAVGETNRALQRFVAEYTEIVDAMEAQ